MKNINTRKHTKQQKHKKQVEQEERDLLDRAVKSARLSGAPSPQLELSSLIRYIEKLNALLQEMQSCYGDDKNFESAIYSINREIQSAANSLIKYRMRILEMERLNLQHG